MIATLVNHAWWCAVTPSAHRFRRALQCPAEAQANVLRRIIRANEHTAFGHDHAFASIHSPEDFVRKVPVRSYDELTPWIDRIVKGEHGVLTTEPVMRLVPSSGSTAARKLIPFTKSLKREFNAAIAPWIEDLFRQRPDLARGPAYWSITPAISATTNQQARGPIPIGFDDDREYLGGVLASVVGKAMAVRPEIARTRHMDAFRYATLLSLLRTPNLRLVSVWHPSFFTLLLGALARNWDRLLDDVATGECSSEHQSHTERSLFSARPQPTRAKLLFQARPGDIAAIWPALSLISCWADAAAAAPAHALMDRCTGAVLQPKGLLATEGVVSIPMNRHHPLAVRSHFLEFVDEVGNAHPAHQLREGPTYQVLLTTGAGLYRYRLGDLVRVDGFIANTPSVRFLGRSDGTSDLVGEKLSEAFAGRAIEQWCALYNHRPTFAMLAPSADREPRRYTLFLSISNPHAAHNLDALEQLLRDNPHYDWARRCGQLAPLTLRPVNDNAFEQYAAALVARGMRLGDIKPTRLSARDDWETVFESRSH